MGARDISGGSPGQARLHLRMSGDMVGNMEEHGEGRAAGTGSTLLLNPHPSRFQISAKYW